MRQNMIKQINICLTNISEIPNIIYGCPNT